MTGQDREQDWDQVPPMVAGLEPDEEVRQWLEEEEAKRRRREETEGRGVEAVVYDPGAGKVSRLTGRILLAILLAVLLVAVLYLVAIPRADAQLVMQYHEGLVGGLAVDARIENHGTRAMTDVSITILVQNSTDVRMADPATFSGQVAAHDDAPMDAVSFTGDQWETYHIFVEWSFDCAGNTYHGTEHLTTEGEAMNVWFVQDLTE